MLVFLRALAGGEGSVVVYCFATVDIILVTSLLANHASPLDEDWCTWSRATPNTWEILADLRVLAYLPCTAMTAHLSFIANQFYLLNKTFVGANRQE